MHILRADVSLARGDLAGAERLAHEALAYPGGGGAEVAGGLVTVAELMAAAAAGGGGWEEAARLFGAADAAFKSRWGEGRPWTSAPYDGARGAALAALGPGRFESAYAAGAAMSSDELVTYLRRRRGERKRPPSGWESLTPAELSVAKLVAEGLSNPKIAEKLLVSPRTVSTHLTHIFAKLGMTSRAELSAEFVRRAV